MTLRQGKSQTRSPRIEQDLNSVDPALRRALETVSDSLGVAVTVQANNGTEVPTRINVDDNCLEIYRNGKWQRVASGDTTQGRSVSSQSSQVLNRYITAGTATKVTYTEEGRITSGEQAGVADIVGLQDALDDKADDGHSHAMSDVTGLGDEFDTKADVSTDGLRVKVWDTGTSEWVYITCANGVLSVSSS